MLTDEDISTLPAAWLEQLWVRPLTPTEPKNMVELIAWFEGLGPVMAALVATLFTWGMTAAGAALVFPFKTMNRRLFDGMLGFTGGVMVAASFWSLLAPAIDMVGGEGICQSGAPAIGFALGALFIYGL